MPCGLRLMSCVVIFADAMWLVCRCADHHFRFSHLFYNILRTIECSSGLTLFLICLRKSRDGLCLQFLTPEIQFGVHFAPPLSCCRCPLQQQSVPQQVAATAVRAQTPEGGMGTYADAPQLHIVCKASCQGKQRLLHTFLQTDRWALTSTTQRSFLEGGGVEASIPTTPWRGRSASGMLGFAARNRKT